MIIAIDFDGTIVTHEYPNIGTRVPNALETMKKLQSQGCKLILYTMRSGEKLQEAVDYLTKNDIILFGINNNPEQSSWTSSPKVYANLYIDDNALGCPLSYVNEGKKPFVDWYKVETILKAKNILV